MKNIHRILCLLGTVLALMLCTVPVNAAKGTTADLDLTKKGSITLTLKDSEGNAMTGGFLDCIQVAEIADNGVETTYLLTNGFQDTDVSLEVFLDGKQSAASLAEKLNDAVPAGAYKIASRPDKTGTVTFSNRELGLYLIRQRAKSGYYESITPFVVTVPMNSDSGWVYDVTASPKVGTVTPKDTAYKSVRRLPQTGQLNWPVPVLAVSGIALFSLGWAMTKDKHEKEHR